ncbi:MAG: DNA pilot protein [Microvirus sp.]|nr:MAG: DNA pilot protein [Microvirus sp.]
MDFTSIAGAGIGAVGNILSSRQANSANQARTSMETMTNLYEGQKTRDFNAQQAQMQRDWSAEQAGVTRAYNSQEAVNARQFDQDMFNQSTAYNSAEQEKARAFNSSEAGLSRDFNSAEAQKSRDFTAGQAANQMSFQERMRATQYQTAMGDMRAAGLNPMLAYSQGGAGTPIGASGSSSAASSSAASSGSASIGSPTGPSASAGPASGASASGSPAHAGHAQPYQAVSLPSLLSAALQVAQIDNVKASTEKTRTDTEVAAGDIIGKKGDEGPSTYTALERQERSKLLNSQVRTEVEKRQLSVDQQALVREEVKNAVERRQQIKADTGNTQVDTVLKALRENEARAGSKFWGKHPEAYDLGQGLKLLSEGIGSALGLTRIFK